LQPPAATTGAVVDVEREVVLGPDEVSGAVDPEVVVDAGGGVVRFEELHPYATSANAATRTTIERCVIRKA
jgi:hypothetical protein